MKNFKSFWNSLYKATPHTEVNVDELPTCDFCDKPAQYDGKTDVGPWANMCEIHFREHGQGLGLGRGQKLTVKKAQAELSPEDQKATDKEAIEVAKSLAPLAIGAGVGALAWKIQSMLNPPFPSVEVTFELTDESGKTQQQTRIIRGTSKEDAVAKVTEMMSEMKEYASQNQIKDIRIASLKEMGTEKAMEKKVDAGGPYLLSIYLAQHARPSFSATIDAGPYSRADTLQQAKSNAQKLLARGTGWVKPEDIESIIIQDKDETIVEDISKSMEKAVGSKFRIMRKWDGKHTEIAVVDGGMEAANKKINDMIASGELPPEEGENREYYILVSKSMEKAQDKKSFKNLWKGKFGPEIKDETEGEAHYKELAEKNPEHAEEFTGMAEDEAEHKETLEEMGKASKKLVATSQEIEMAFLDAHEYLSGGNSGKIIRGTELIREAARNIGLDYSDPEVYMALSTWLKNSNWKIRRLEKSFKHTWKGIMGGGSSSNLEEVTEFTPAPSARDRKGQEEKSIRELPDYISVNQIQHDGKKWLVTCDKCGGDFVASSKRQAEEWAIVHQTMKHTEKSYRTGGGHMRETPEEAGYEVVESHGNELILRDRATRQLEAWGISVDFAGYGIVYHGQTYGFMHSVSEKSIPSELNTKLAEAKRKFEELRQQGTIGTSAQHDQELDDALTEVRRIEAEMKNKSMEKDYDPEYIEWEREVTDELIDLIGVTNSDAQGIMDLHKMELLLAWQKKTSPKEAAKIIDRVSTVKSVDTSFAGPEPKSGLAEQDLEGETTTKTFKNFWSRLNK